MALSQRHDLIVADGARLSCRRCGREFSHEDPDLRGRCEKALPATYGPVEGSPAARPRVSLVVTGHNNARWLAECLRSCLNQSIPCEVIYSDDASTDESVEIAGAFSVLVVEGTTHSGPCRARNRGAAIARGEFLVFVDADDYLSPTFAADHLAAMQPGVPFCYGPAQAFGDGPDAGTLWRVPPWQAWDRWLTNTVNTSALYRASAFRAAGGWSDQVPTMWDWDLALRVARLAERPPVPSGAVLMYRQHPASWSASVDEKNTSDMRAECMAAVRRLNARVTVCCMYSGRLPELLPEWADRLAGSVRFAELTNPVDLVMLCHNASAYDLRVVRGTMSRYRETFSGIRIEGFANLLKWSTESERRDQVASMLAVAYEAMRDRSTGDVLFFVEDDVLLPRPGVRRLWQTLTAGHQPPHAVSGVYRNRHVPEQFIGGWRREHGWEEFQELPADGQPFDVDVAGTGCLMTWRDRPAIPRGWRSHEERVAAHDWAYCRDIGRAGGRVLMHPGVPCDHVRAMGDVLRP